jgi:hypothetical protein
MICECGHYRSVHRTTGWPRFEPTCESFTCCNRSRSTSPGSGGREHDFVDHKVLYCKCKGFVQQQENEVTA